MKKFLEVVLIVFFTLILTQCQEMSEKENNLPGENELSVSWELFGNDLSGSPAYNAEFVIENKSDFELGNSDWCMYFNQMTANVIPSSVSGNVRFEHINGDLYKMTPTEKFLLVPGNKININYKGRGTIIKNTYVPSGPYFVFSDSADIDQAVVAVNQYEVKPLPGFDKIFPEGSDIPYPDAEWQYERNKGIRFLSEDRLKKVLPEPVDFNEGNKKVELGKGLIIYYLGELRAEADHLANSLDKLLKKRPAVKKGKGNGTNTISLKPGEIAVSGNKKEAYSLEILPEQGILIEGSDPAGVFYGIQSLLALMPVELFESPAEEVELNTVSISDAPAFNYRGMHLDIARNFIEKEDILKLLDVMSFYKMNRLQLHLCDDEGWRLEIEELPELSEIGAYRGHSTGNKKYLPPSYGSGPYPDPEISSGSGFLTREDFKEILKFAKKRHIEIIPEINMPGHARAAIKSMEVRYNRLKAAGKIGEAEKYLLNDPDDTSEYSSAQHFNDNVVCVCKESVYNFYETVLDDIIEMYREADVPLSTIHTGGDEVPAGVWEGSPVCSRYLEENPSVGNVRNLQSMFFDRIVKLIEERKLKIAGWEEVAMKFTGPHKWIPNREFIGKNVIPYVWNSVWGNQDLGYKLANEGYPVILCNVNNFYFDMAYNHHPEEPGLFWGGFVNTKNAFEFVPFDLFKSTFVDQMGDPFDPDKDFKGMIRLKPEAQKNIIGLQGELWSETITSSEKLEYYYLPKIIGLAERAWSGQPVWGMIDDIEERKEEILSEWNIFANSIGQREFKRLDNIFGGFNYRIPPPGAVINNETLFAGTGYPGLTIRYTTDGTEPDENSAVYSKPVNVTGNVILKAFNSKGRSGRSSTVKVD